MTTVITNFRKIDILVNNAGIMRNAPFLEMTEEDWDAVLEINLKGVFLCTQAAAKYMIQQKYGKVINIGSMAGLGAGEPSMANYAAAKAGIRELPKVTAKALDRTE